MGAVVRHMNTLEDSHNRLSKITTVKVIHEFESSGVITIEKPKRKGQGYRLLLNEGNAFNLIDKWIRDIGVIGEIVRKNRAIVFKAYDDISLDSEHKELDELLTHFDQAREVIITMIHFLLLEIYRKIESDNDKLTLSLKTVNLIIENLSYPVVPQPPLTLVEYYRHSGLEVSDSSITFGKSMGIQSDYFRHLIEKIDAFDGQFLLKQISTDGHNP